MHAIIATGGKQYRVEPEAIIDVELLDGDTGGKVEFNEVLAIEEGTDLRIGNPTVEGAKVEGEIVKNFRGKKLIAFKFKRRKGYHKTKGHRQDLCKVRISKIIA